MDRGKRRGPGSNAGPFFVRAQARARTDGAGPYRKVRRYRACCPYRVLIIRYLSGVAGEAGVSWTAIIVALQATPTAAPTDSILERYNSCASRMSAIYTQGNEPRPNELAAIACEHIIKPAPAEPFKQDGWRYFDVSAKGPSLAYPNDAPFYRLIISCKEPNISFHVRGLEPKQQWPQPELAVTIGSVSRTDRPDLSYSKGSTAFATSFPIADSILNAIRSGAAITTTFGGQRVSYPAPPAAMRMDFAAKCEAYVPPEMRAG